MTVKELIHCLENPDHNEHKDVKNARVVFDTVSDWNLEVLSVYYDRVNGYVVVDVGR